MMPKTNRAASLTTVAICSMIFFVSMCLPALNFVRNPGNGPIQSYPGGLLVLLGWVEAINFSERGIGWFANPFFFVGMILVILRRFGWAAVIFCIAAAFASAAFNIKSVIADEGGNEAEVVGLGSGFWLWHFSILASALASFVFWMTDQKRPEVEAIQKAGLALPMK